MNDLSFRRITLADKEVIQGFTFTSSSHNCDLNFMNLCSWQFLYNTEYAVVGSWLVFRFYTDGHLAYMLPRQKGDPQEILSLMLDDSRRLEHPFLMLGVCENFIPQIDRAMPEFFHFSHDRDYTDYIYDRDALASLAGKRLQPKRNHVNKFVKAYPDYVFRSITPDIIPLCRELEVKWKETKKGDEEDADYENERRSMNFVFDHWDELDAIGGCIFVGGKLVAFTFGAKINDITFDVCVEKADTEYDGAYAVINRDFVRSLPENIRLINREEDLGIAGLRQAKLSYQPSILLHKYTVMERRPLSDGQKYFVNFRRASGADNK